jgi:hypothetical protein
MHATFPAHLIPPLLHDSQCVGMFVVYIHTKFQMYHKLSPSDRKRGKVRTAAILLYCILGRNPRQEPHILAMSVTVRYFTSLHWVGRSEWPRGLRHEMSSLARTLESWVRVPLKTWMFVCVSLCLCFPLPVGYKYGDLALQLGESRI